MNEKEARKTLEEFRMEYDANPARYKTLYGKWFDHEVTFEWVGIVSYGASSAEEGKSRIPHPISDQLTIVSGKHRRFVDDLFNEMKRVMGEP